VFYDEVFIREFFTINRFTTGAIACLIVVIGSLIVVQAYQYDVVAMIRRIERRS